MFQTDECTCCGDYITPEAARAVSRVWEGRLDGYCVSCSYARCDVEPCGKREN